MRQRYVAKIKLTAKEASGGNAILRVSTHGEQLQDDLDVPVEIAAAVSENTFSNMFPECYIWSPDGSLLYYILDAGTGSQLTEYPVPVAWDASSIVTYNHAELWATTDDYHGFNFSGDGTRLYIVNKTLDDIDEYPLSTAWDLSTIGSKTTSLDVSSNSNNPEMVRFNSDGTKMYILTSSDIAEYTLATAYDLTDTVTYVDSFSPEFSVTEIVDFDFSSSGCHLNLLIDGGTHDDEIVRWVLDTAYDLSTAVSTYSSSYSLSAVGFGTPVALLFKPDSTAFWYGDSIKLYKFSVNTNAYFPPHMELKSVLSHTFGRASDEWQVPAQLLVLLWNKSNIYSDYLPDGNDPQYWNGAEFTLYECDVAAAGAALSALTVAYRGKIADGMKASMLRNPSIEFDVYDRRLEDNIPIAVQQWSEHASYNAGSHANVAEAGETIPVILGDWTVGDARIPARLIGLTGSVYTYAVCNHEISTLTVYDTDGNTITTTATTLTRGEFTVTTGATDYQDGENLYVTCKGYPTDLTDSNPARLVQFLLTEFAGADADADIYNKVGATPNNQRGSFEEFYNWIGGSSADIPVRLYISDPGTRVVNAAASVAYQGNGRLSLVDDQYRLYQYTPIVASDVLEIQERYIDSESDIDVYDDPDEEFCTVIRAAYLLDPATNTYLSLEDTGVTVTSGLIYDARSQYKSLGALDVYLSESYDAIYTDTGAQASTQNKLFWRIRSPQQVTVRVLDYSQTGDRKTIQLFNDFKFPFGEVTGNIYHVLSFRKDPNSGAVELRGLSLNNLPVASIWADGDGEDAAGQVVENSVWSDSDGLNNSGAKNGAVWF